MPFLRKFDSKIQDAAQEVTEVVFANQSELVSKRLRLPATQGGDMIRSMEDVAPKQHTSVVFYVCYCQWWKEAKVRGNLVTHTGAQLNPDDSKTWLATFYENKDLLPAARSLLRQDCCILLKKIYGGQGRCVGVYPRNVDVQIKQA